MTLCTTLRTFRHSGFREAFHTYDAAKNRASREFEVWKPEAKAELSAMLTTE